MDLKLYYQKVKTQEATLDGEYVVVATNEEGMPEPRFVEVTRSVAAKLIVQGKMRTATAEETERFRAAAEDARRAAEEREAKARVKLQLISDSELAALRGSFQKGK